MTTACRNLNLKASLKLLLPVTHPLSAKTHVFSLILIWVIIVLIIILKIIQHICVYLWKNLPFLIILNCLFAFTDPSVSMPTVLRSHQDDKHSGRHSAEIQPTVLQRPQGQQQGHGQGQAHALHARHRL